MTHRIMRAGLWGDSRTAKRTPTGPLADYVVDTFQNAQRNQEKNDDALHPVGASPFRNRYQNAVLRN